MKIIFFQGMSRGELVDTLARLTVHNDEELRGLACQGLQNLVIDFPDWREDVLYGFMQFVVKVNLFLFGSGVSKLILETDHQNLRLG